VISSAVPVVLIPEVVSNVSLVLLAVYSQPCPYMAPGLRNLGNTYTPDSRRAATTVEVVEPVSEAGKYSP
jgi:hypothetical protein